MVIRRLFKALWVVLGTAAILICLTNIAFYQLGKSTDIFATRWDGRIWNPPRCIVDEEILGVVFLPTEEFWKRGVGLGTVVVHPKTDKLFLALDNTHFDRMPPEVQRFIIHHECAHVKLGHLKRIIHNDPNSLEKKADCFAMTAIIQEGWSSERIDNLFSAMVDPDLMVPAFWGVQYNARTEKAHAWSPQERIEHAKSCITP